MWLPLLALLGFIVPNGFFVYWLLFEFHGLGPVLQDKLAIGFMLDVLLALIILSVYLAGVQLGTRSGIGSFCCRCSEGLHSAFRCTIGSIGASPRPPPNPRMQLDSAPGRSS